MSMYATSWCEKGLLLTGADLSTLKNNYLTLHPDVDEENFDDHCNHCEDMEPSDPTREIKSFCIAALCVENCEGTALHAWEGENNWQEYNGEDTYIILLDKDETNPFKPFPYKDMNEVIDEIKHKVGGYLPKNFDYKERIGTISCSYYA